MNKCMVSPERAGDPRFSYHSRQRMHELRITDAMVRDVLDAPLTSQPGDAGHRNNSVIYTGRAIRVVANPINRTIITVQLRTPIPYQHGVHHLDKLPDKRQREN